MNNIVITPSKLNGQVSVPPSKSLSHRAIICGALCSDGRSSIIDNVILSEDIKATIEGMRELGAIIDIIEKENKTYNLIIKRSNKIIEDVFINCKESGSTLRFLIPIGLILTKKCTFTGCGKLVERPLDVYYKIFDKQNISYKTNGRILPLSVSGTLKYGDYKVSGSISSQFISGLLFSLPLLENDSTIKVIDNMQSKRYVDLTIDILNKFNIHVENKNYKEFKIKGNSQYKSTSYTVEGDYSQAAFFLVANKLGNNVKCLGLNANSLQGDKEIINIIKKYNSENNDEITINASQIPDLVPILTVLASFQAGKTTRIVKAGRLRIKESDRLKAINCEMNKIGADIQELEDGLLIKGQDKLKGNATVSSWNDHRIAMSLAIAATKCEHEIILENYMAVNKSYPLFWNDYKALGGVVNEFNVGNKLKLSIFGESHGEAIGCVIDGLPSGIELDFNYISEQLKRRSPGKSSLSSTRVESDQYEILSGFFEGKTTGAPLCAIMNNEDIRSKDYSLLKTNMRPGHSDYPAKIKYLGFNDYRGGGHFSGRITAPLLFAGAIAMQILEKYKNIYIVSRIKSIFNIEDKTISKLNIDELKILKSLNFPVISEEKGSLMQKEILLAKEDGDSVGGIIETFIVNLDAGFGEPFFDSVESKLSHMIFSIPSVKGIEFGEGFNITRMRGLLSNDSYYINEKKIETKSNNNGGIIGGITTGMPVVFRTAIKPTPSISLLQKTVNISSMENTELKIEGRHDPCIVPRVLPVIEGASALVILDFMLEREGEVWKKD